MQFEWVISKNAPVVEFGKKIEQSSCIKNGY